jgi:hypothetical protein
VGEAIGRVVDGIPTILLIEGGSGTGKTTFLRRVAAAAQGFRPLRLQADNERQKPYTALTEWRVLESPANPGLTSLQAARILRSWIEETRAGAQVLMLIDDLHMLDTESSDMVARLIERTFIDRLLIAATADSLTRPTLSPWRRLAIDTDRAVHVRPPHRTRRIHRHRLVMDPRTHPGSRRSRFRWRDLRLSVSDTAVAEVGRARQLSRR